MSLSVGFRIFRSGVMSFALALLLALGVLPGAGGAAVRSAAHRRYDFAELVLRRDSATTAPNGPVVVFVHGLGGKLSRLDGSQQLLSSSVGRHAKAPNNDMYDYAYQAGFRTVFLSMSSDNSTNSASIQTNAAMLQTMFPQILSHYGVTKVYFVCHSKGGLDLQDAIANPQWIGMASAVITLGTPNQGDALADWIFQSGRTRRSDRHLGLLTPAVQSLEIANVEQLRIQWDRDFQQRQNSLLHFVGQYLYVSDRRDTCPTGITGPHSDAVTITGGDVGKAPSNDGLVDHPESLLPTTYAMELGIINCNHFLAPGR